MSARALRGLEMVCLTREGDFAIDYGGGGKYVDEKGQPVEDLADMGCLGCGSGYFTRESSAIEFCPACGYFERKRFKDFQELQKWSNGQSWKFLKRNGHKAFGGFRGGEWRLTFAVSKDELEMSGQYSEVHDLLGGK